MYLKDIIYLNFQPDCFVSIWKKISKEGSVAPRKPGQLLQTIALLTPAFHILHNAAFRKATMSLAGLLLSPLSHSGVRWSLVRLEGVHIPKEGIPEQGVLFGFPDL